MKKSVFVVVAALACSVCPFNDAGEGTLSEVVEVK